MEHSVYDFNIDALKKYSCIIFDLDGTLIDSFEAINDAFDAVFIKFSGRRISFEESNSYVGVPLEDLLGDMFGKENQREAIEIFRNKYNEICFKKTSLIDGVQELLYYLKNAGKTLNVATNKTGSISRSLLKHLNIYDLFDYIYGVYDGFEGKPSPQMLHTIVQNVGVSNSSTIFIGDSPIDIMTAKNAGVSILSVASGNHTYDELSSFNPDFLVDHIVDILSTAKK
jgi:HAD superfamily hydrolase (TIGR01549 family)